ncbi:MAG: hypothetical protein QG668_559 [Patescibacteria group bacterium]|nr:hypothetical protein [Patescibacteria group bacterium]
MSRTKQQYAAENRILFDLDPSDKQRSPRRKRHHWRRHEGTGPTKFFEPRTDQVPKTVKEAIVLAKQARSLG